MTPQDKHNKYIIDKINRELEKENAWRTADYWDRAVVICAAIIAVLWYLSYIFM